MSRALKLNAMLSFCFGIAQAAAAAGAIEPERPRAAVLSDAECWKLLAPAEAAGKGPLPSWARALAGSIPRSTAALLRVDFVQRAHSPIEPKLRARMRFVTAHANHCAYSVQYALFDARRAGLDEAAVAALARGELAPDSPATLAALEFARKMTVDPASVTDDEFAALVKHFGDKTVVAMVQLLAWSNFQDRVVLCLGSEIEPAGPLPPAELTFSPGFLISRQPEQARRQAQTNPQVQINPGAGKDLVEDGAEWTSIGYEELQARLERQRNRNTRVRVPTWEEVERVIPPGFMWPNRVVWNLVCMGYQPELGGAWETYLRTSSVETASELNRLFGQSLFWVTTRAINCPYCMGHCEMGLELAGLSKSEIAERTRQLAGGDWSVFPAEEQRAYAFARKLTTAPWTISKQEIDTLLRDFGPTKGIVVLVAACRGHYMTRVSNGFQLSLERDNVFRNWQPKSSVAAVDPPPVPLTRPEMKLLLEESKSYAPRLKAPEPTEEEWALVKSQGLASRGSGNIRNLLPQEVRRGAFFFWDGRTQEMDVIALRNPTAPPPTADEARLRASANRTRARLEPDPNMTLDYAFKTMLFWIVSRGNNCIYCMGHQEAQLPAFGVSEDRIAALDGDWSEFTHAERAAFTVARKLTVAPHTLTDADIDALRRHFKDIQVQEIIGIVAGFNAMNRWTGPLRLTQQDFRLYLTPTSPKYTTLTTKVGPVPAGASGTRCMPAANPRPPIESRSEVQARWADCRQRKPRFTLVDQSVARGMLPEETFPSHVRLPNWVCYLLNFPKSGPAKIAELLTSETKGKLSPRLNAQLAWVSARADHAWYALAYARERLRTLGVSDDAIFAIDQPSDPTFSPAERAAFGFAKKLTVDPALIGGADFDMMRKHFGESEIAEMIYHVNHDVLFNRITEAAQLRLDEPSIDAASRK
jgi:alkylhydroperoxidase family enzyme